jgi:hypothetical protein
MLWESFSQPLEIVPSANLFYQVELESSPARLNVESGPAAALASDVRYQFIFPTLACHFTASNVCLCHLFLGTRQQGWVSPQPKLGPLHTSQSVHVMRMRIK